MYVHNIVSQIYKPTRSCTFQVPFSYVKKFSSISKSAQAKKYAQKIVITAHILWSHTSLVGHAVRLLVPVATIYRLVQVCGVTLKSGWTRTLPARPLAMAML